MYINILLTNLILGIKPIFTMTAHVQWHYGMRDNYVSPLTERWGHVAEYPCLLSLSAQLVSVRSLLLCRRSNMRRWPNAGLKLAHSLRRWPSIKQALVQRFVFAGSQSVSLCCGESVTDSFLSSASYGTGGETQDVDRMLDKCWPTVYDAEPTLAQYWVPCRARRNAECGPASQTAGQH